MKPYGVNDLRRMYLEFFESKEHLRLKSFSLQTYTPLLLYTVRNREGSQKKTSGIVHFSQPGGVVFETIRL